MPIYGCDSLCHVHVHDPRSNPNIVNIHCHVSIHDTHIWTSEYVHARLTRAVTLTLCIVIHMTIQCPYMDMIFSVVYMYCI